MAVCRPNNSLSSSEQERERYSSLPLFKNKPSTGEHYSAAGSLGGWLGVGWLHLLGGM